MFKKSLKKCIDSGAADELKTLLKANPKLTTAPISWGGVACKTEPLHYLCDGFFNHFWEHAKEGELARIFLDAGAPVNGGPDAGESPLHGAASLGCTDVARELVSSGANLEVVAKYPGIPLGTPLDFAVHFGMVGVVDLLVACGARISSARMEAGGGLLEELRNRISATRPSHAEMMDAFRCAAVCDRCEVVDYFLDEGLDIHEEVNGGTALHWAAWEAKATMVKHLIEKGAAVDRSDSEHGATAINWARHRQQEIGTHWGHDRVIELLETVNS